MVGYTENSTGERSSGRMLMVFVVVAIVLTWSTSAIIATFKNTQPINVPWEMVFLAATTIAGKVANSALTETKG